MNEKPPKKMGRPCLNHVRIVAWVSESTKVEIVNRAKGRTIGCVIEEAIQKTTNQTKSNV